MPLRIPNITLVVLSGKYTAFTELSLKDTLSKFKFDQILIFSNSHFPSTELEARVVVTPMTSMDYIPRIYWREIYPRLNTDYALIMEWDGYPINPDQWSGGFRAYDYIGAVWPWYREHSVGNSGFCLISKKLLHDIYTDIKFPLRLPTDVTLCREMRPYLEDHYGTKFAPEEVADLFSVEHGKANPQSFGFHGLWNMIYFLTDEELKHRLSLLTPNQWNNAQVDNLLSHALLAGRREFYRWLLDKINNIRQSKEANPYR